MQSLWKPMFWFLWEEISAIAIAGPTDGHGPHCGFGAEAVLVSLASTRGECVTVFCRMPIPVLVPSSAAINIAQRAVSCEPGRRTNRRR